MAINFPGPYELRIFYAVDGPRNPKTHVQRNNLVLSDDPVPGTETFDEIDVVLRNSTTQTLDVVTDEWVDLIRELYADGGDVVFTNAELWRYEPGTFLATFIAGYALSLDGVSTANTLIASQEIYTFRTQEGGIMKVSLMETVQSPGPPVLFSDLHPSRQAIVAYLLAVDSPFIARDTSPPIAFMKMFPGQNESTFKWRHRDA